MEMHFQNQNSKLSFLDEEVDTLANTMGKILHGFQKFPKIENTKKSVFHIVFHSKLVLGYFLVKVLYLLNGILQLCFIHVILGFGKSLTNFVDFIRYYMENFDDWKGGIYFPRVSYCYIEYVQSVSQSHNFIAQCSLGVNMINEKIYFFLWVWTLLIIVVTFLRLNWWCMMILYEGYQIGFVRSLLANCGLNGNDADIRRFIHNYLRGDGIFMVLMMRNKIHKELWYMIFERLWKSFENVRQVELADCKCMLHKGMNGDLCYV